MSNLMTIKFWGVRGSYPTPGASTIHYGGNTSCIEVNAGGQTIILDAGTGIIPLGKALMRRAHRIRRACGPQTPIEATILLSHLHHDHIQGFPFFSPAYSANTRLRLFGPKQKHSTLQAHLSDTMQSPSFPITFEQLKANYSIHCLEGQDVLNLDSSAFCLYRGGDKWITSPKNGVLIRVMHSNTHPGGVLFYRIEWQGRAIVYATDTETRQASDQQRLAAFAEGADLLIHDAQYTEEHYFGHKASHPMTQGWGHSTPTFACAVARAAGVKQLALFHYEPDYDDKAIAQQEMKARTRFPNTIAPYEGLELSFTAAPKQMLPIKTKAAYNRPLAILT